MTFTPGKYALEAFSATALGGKLATGNGIDEVVTVADEVPPFRGQIWDINAVDGKEGVYTIALDTNGTASAGSWSLKESSPESPPGGPVILFSKAHEWYIYSSDNGFAVIKIQPVRTDHYVGSDFYVGTNENQVAIQAIPVVPGEEDKIPYWQAIQKK